MKALVNPATATLDYQEIVANPAIEVVYISTTPEPTHYTIARDCLKAGKHVLLEKPIAMEFWQADELIGNAKQNNVKFTIGYSQRFNPKVAYAKKKITDGTLGRVVSVMVSRHLSRSLGQKIAARVRMSPAAMESTHDLDLVFWLLEPAKPIKVYSQGGYGFMQAVNGSYDVLWSNVTMDDGTLVVIGGGWNLPPSYPNFCANRLAIGKKLGADHIINSRTTDAVAEVMRLTGGIGADYVVECAGTASALDEAVHMVNRGGKICLAAFPHDRVEMDVAHLVRNNVSLFGIRGEGRSATHRAMALMAAGRFDATLIHTHSFPFEEFETGLRYARDRVDDAIKVVVTRS